MEIETTKSCLFSEPYENFGCYLNPNSLVIEHLLYHYSRHMQALIKLSHPAEINKQAFGIFIFFGAYV